MEEEITLSKVGMYVTRDCLVVPIQVELHDELVTQIQEDILRRVKGERLKGVVIDLSGVAILDSVLARGVFDTAQMTSLLGARTVITGLSAGVVASLIDLDFAPGNVPIALTLDEGLQTLEPYMKPKEEPEEAEEPEEEID